jgi:hypothetical protein
MKEKHAIALIFLMCYIGITMFCAILLFNYVIPAWYTFDYTLFATITGLIISMFISLTIVTARAFKN